MTPLAEVELLLLFKIDFTISQVVCFLQFYKTFCDRMKDVTSKMPTLGIDRGKQLAP